MDFFCNNISLKYLVSIFWLFNPIKLLKSLYPNTRARTQGPINQKGTNFGALNYTTC
jgi:hypothetical protein